MDNRVFQVGAKATPPTPPAAPSNGYPTNGDPVALIPATQPGDYWFHQIGEELRAAIIEASLVPDTNSLNQLAKAISTQSIAAATRYRQAAILGCSVMIEI